MIFFYRLVFINSLSLHSLNRYIRQMAKMMRYVNVRQIICDTTFGFWVLSWFVTRHVFYNIVIISALVEAPLLISLVWQPEKGHYINVTGYYVFTGLLIALQVSAILSCGHNDLMDFTADYPAHLVRDDLPRCVAGSHDGERSIRRQKRRRRVGIFPSHGTTLSDKTVSRDSDKNE